MDTVPFVVAVRRSASARVGTVDVPAAPDDESHSQPQREAVGSGAARGIEAAR